MAAPGDPDFEPESGPDEYLDDDISTLRGSVRRQLFRGRRTPTTGSNTSKQSKHSLRGTPLKEIRRRLTNSSQARQVTPEGERKRVSELIEFLSEGQPGTDSFLVACNWYVDFIDSKIRAHWSVIRRVVAGVEADASSPNADDIAKVDKVLAFIARHFSQKKDFALVEIVNDLINEELIVDNPTDERVGLHQLMFTFVGWLTILYAPRLDCKPKKLQVSKFAINTEGNKVNLQSQAFDTHSQDLEYLDQSLYLLLGRFGKLIPDLPFHRQSEVAPPSEWIVVPFVCYQTLRAVCRVKIEWVDALSLHLEFDSNSKVLKIFRFPSFCRLMYKHKQRGLFSQLFDDKERDLRGEPHGNFYISDYFREMLLTYRLIFGQDAKSSRLFAKELAGLDSAPRSLSSPFKSASASAAKGPQPPRHVLALADADPLLERLCSARASAPGAREVYAEVGAATAQAYYTPQSYPFFAAKLLALQAYVKEQHPHDWRALWHDHRDKSNWWQFWAVLFIGGGTLMLGTLGLAFQIWQAVLTQQQLQQGMNNSPPALPPGNDI